MKTAITVLLRWMTKKDLAEVAAISRESYADSWSEQEFASALSERNTIGVVAEHEGQVVGYTIYELRPDRVELIDLVVRVSHRGHRIGSQLVASLERRLHSTGRSHVAVAVDEANLSGQLFLAAMGFRATGIDRRHWGDDVDAYLMRLDVPAEVSVNG